VHAAIETAVEAVTLGAVGDLSKPLDFARLDHLFAAVREERERRQALLAVEGEVARRLECEGLIGRSAAAVPPGVSPRTCELTRSISRR
jgi:ActR/RegA family two-component response regulator